MIYLFDTDLLIFMVRGLKAANRRVRNRREAAILLDQCRKAQGAGDSVGLSAVTVSELEFGARKSGNDDEIAAVRKVLTPSTSTATTRSPARNTTGGCGMSWRRKAKTDRLDGHADRRPCALALNAALVTANDAHFSRSLG